MLGDLLVGFASKDAVENVSLTARERGLVTSLNVVERDPPRHGMGRDIDSRAAHPERLSPGSPAHL
jgi:hypothetical protein